MSSEFGDRDIGPLSSKTPLAAKMSWVLITVGLVLVVLMRTRGTPPSDGRHGPAIGKSLAKFDVKELSNPESHIRLEDLRGKVVLVNFWGPWCLFCREEMPRLVKLDERYRQRKDFQFVAIACAQAVDEETHEFKKRSIDYLESIEADFPIYLDPGGATRFAVAEASTVKGFGYPTTLILDQQGNIRGYWDGFQRGDEVHMQTLLEELLGSGSK